LPLFTQVPRGKILRTSPLRRSTKFGRKAPRGRHVEVGTSGCDPKASTKDWPCTVKRHLTNVYQKVGGGSRTEAVRMVLQEQWIGLTGITEAAPSRDGLGPGGLTGV
jgi:hypothetical protein